MALQLANVALSDTFNTWRVRTNQVLEQAVSGTSTTAQSITANVALSGRLTGDAAAFTGLVTAPRFNANNLGGTLTTAAQGNITSVGTLTSLSVGQITGTSGAGFAGLVTAPRVNANNLGGTLTTAAQGNITSIGTLTSLTVTGDLTVDTNTLKVNSSTNRVGVACTSPTTALDVTGTVTATAFAGDGSGLSGINAGATVTNKSDNVNYNVVFTNETSGTQALAGIDVGAFTFNPSTGQCNATDFNSTSDVALKENLSPVDNALDIINQLTGYTFDWKNQKRSSVGVTAQDVEKVLPSLVTELETHKSVNYNGLIGVLIQAVKELNDQLNSLKK